MAPPPLRTSVTLKTSRTTTRRACLTPGRQSSFCFFCQSLSGWEQLTAAHKKLCQLPFLLHNAESCERTVTSSRVVCCHSYASSLSWAPHQEKHCGVLLSFILSLFLSLCSAALFVSLYFHCSCR